MDTESDQSEPRADPGQDQILSMAGEKRNTLVRKKTFSAGDARSTGDDTHPRRSEQ